MSDIQKPPKMRETHRDLIYPPGQAAFAHPNGSRIKKINSEDGDLIPDGLKGKVLSSHNVPYEDLVAEGDKAYFVEWDWYPNMAFGVAASQIELVKD